MGSAFMGLNTALSGVLGSQLALDTTAHNISNANVEGYKRQRTNFATATPLSLPGMNMVIPSQVGTGVTVDSISNLSDRIAERNLLDSFGRLASSESALASLDRMETILGEPGAGAISSAFNRYFNAMEDVASNPSDLAARQALMDSASALADRFNQVGADLAQLDADANQRLDDIVVEVNNLSQQIATLNARIRDANLAGQNPNFELAERTRLMNEMGELVNVTYTFSPADDQVTITYPGPPVTNVVDPAAPGGFAAIARADLDPPAYGGNLVRGEAFALQDLRNNILPAYSQGFVDLVNDFTGVMNAQQLAGFDLTGATGANQMFNVAAGLPIGVPAVVWQNMTLNITTPNQIAAAGSWNGPGEPGNSDNMNLMLVQRNTVQGAPINDTWEGYWRTQIASIGSATATMRRTNDNNGALVTSLRDVVDQVSGVSIDEEMTNMVKFQHAYNASARILTTMDDMLDTLINRTGRAGL